MLPPPLAPPLPSRPIRGPRRRIPWLALLGFALILVAVVGAIAWAGAFSPYGFVRFSGPPADRTITISRPGDYLIYEEGADATDSDLPPRAHDHRERPARSIASRRTAHRSGHPRRTLRLPRTTPRRSSHRSVHRAEVRFVSPPGQRDRSRDRRRRGLSPRSAVEPRSGPRTRDAVAAHSVGVAGARRACRSPPRSSCW